MSEREENGKERTNRGHDYSTQSFLFFKYTILKIYFGTEKSVLTNVRHLVLVLGLFTEKWVISCGLIKASWNVLFCSEVRF